MADSTTEKTLNVSCTVVVDVKDRAGVIERYLPGGEFYGEHPYGCRTEDELLKHLAFNAVSNGVTQASDLEGWADLPSEACTMFIDRNSMEIN